MASVLEAGGLLGVWTGKHYSTETRILLRMTLFTIRPAIYLLLILRA